MQRYDFFRKSQKKSTFLIKYLVMSKKSSTFALAFEKKHGPLAQLNRVPHYGCGGCRFESCTDHTKDAQHIERLFLFVTDDIIRDI